MLSRRCESMGPDERQNAPRKRGGELFIE